MSAENEGVFVNGVQAAGKTGNAKFTAYISPYMVVNSGGWYSSRSVHLLYVFQRQTNHLNLILRQQFIFQLFHLCSQ